MCDLVAGCCRTHRRRTGFFTDARIDRCLRCCRRTVIDRRRIPDAETLTDDAQGRNGLGDVGRHKDFRRTAVGNLLQCIEALQLQHTLTDLRTVQTLDTTCLRLIDEVDTLRLTFRQGDLCISLRLRGDDLRLLVTLRSGDDRFLMRLCLEHGLTALTLCTHLLRHDLLDLLRRLNVLNFDSRNLDAPRVRRHIQCRLHARIDLITARQGLIELHVTDDRTQRRRRQILKTRQRILYAIHKKLRILHLHEHHRIDGHGNIILRDHRLRREIQHLLLQAHLLDDPLHDRNLKVKTRTPGAAVLPQHLRHIRMSLRHDADHPHQHHDD